MQLTRTAAALAPSALSWILTAIRSLGLRDRRDDAAGVLALHLELEEGTNAGKVARIYSLLVPRLLASAHCLFDFVIIIIIVIVVVGVVSHPFCLSSC